MERMMKAMKAIPFAFALALATVPAHAQTPDSRWSPWLGCWELTAENVRAAAAAPASPGRGSLSSNARSAQGRVDFPRVCVTGADSGGARFETTVSGQPAVDYTIIPGGDRPFSDAECKGTQRAEW